MWPLPHLPWPRNRVAISRFFFSIEVRIYLFFQMESPTKSQCIKPVTAEQLWLKRGWGTQCASLSETLFQASSWDPQSRAGKPLAQLRSIQPLLADCLCDMGLSGLRLSPGASVTRHHLYLTALLVPAPLFVPGWP